VSTSEHVLKEIAVYEPIPVNISANISNKGSIEVANVTISFYVDGELVGTNITDVPANSTSLVYLIWSASESDKGEHVVEIRINEEGTLLEFDTGDNVMKKTIYIGERPERELSPIMGFNNAGVMFLIFFFAIIFLLGAFWMRYRTLRGRSHYDVRSNYGMYFMGILMIALSFPVMYVSQVLTANPVVDGDSTIKMIEGIVVFILGFLIILLTWDRVRKKRR
jgi:hypothetical protein